jgi:hypothetical protein
MTGAVVKPHVSGRTTWRLLAGTAATGVALLTAWLVSSQQSQEIRGSSIKGLHRAQCASNLHQIGRVIALYRSHHAGRYPDDLATLLTEGKLAPAVFVCPSADDAPAAGATTQEILADFAKPHHRSYSYHGKGLIDPVDPNRVIAAEPLSNHDDEGIDVLFGDGHAEWCRMMKRSSYRRSIFPRRQLRDLTRLQRPVEQHHVPH